MEESNVIGAFSEEQTSEISGVSLYQLRQWSEEGFFRPSFDVGHKHVPYGRLYSFRDLVSLQVLNDLRNKKQIPLGHLRQVSEKLSHLGERRWIATTLYVLGKRVVFENPKTHMREEIVSGQRVFNIPLRVVARSTRQRIDELNERGEQVGKFAQSRFVSQNARVFSGTRVPVSAVIDFLSAGYSVDQVLREFPNLEPADIQAVSDELMGVKAA